LNLTATSEIKLNPGETKTFLIKADKVGYNTNEDSVDMTITFKKANAIIFDDGDTTDAYRVTNLSGVNMSEDSVSAKLTIK